MDSLSKILEFTRMRFLHFAPEHFFVSHFRNWFAQYDTADYEDPNVDYKVDLRNLPFGDKTYDFVFASHVLEHIKEDRTALAEIRRILRPGGVAILPLPFVCNETVEYPEPNAHDNGHVRAVGWDYLDRYNEFFDRVECYETADFSERYQLYVYEDRSQWPNDQLPLRPPMFGDKHKDIVPICYVES